MAAEKITSDPKARKRAAREYKRLRNIRNWTKVEDGLYEISVGEGRERRWYRLVKCEDEYGRKHPGEWEMRTGDGRYVMSGAKPKGWEQWASEWRVGALKQATQRVAADDLGLWSDQAPYHLDRDTADGLCEELWRD